MSQTRSIVAGGTVAVLLLGVGTLILFAEPSPMNGGFGGPLVVAAAPETDPPPSASPAATDESTPPSSVLVAPPTRLVAWPAAAAAPSDRSGGNDGTVATTAVAPTSSVDRTASGSTRHGGRPANDPASPATASGRASTSTPALTASPTATTSVDAGAWWRTVSPDSWAVPGQQPLPVGQGHANSAAS
jgi:hypothetical protein